jgi:hypothetical protein
MMTLIQNIILEILKNLSKYNKYTFHSSPSILKNKRKRHIAISMAVI